MLEYNVGMLLQSGKKVFALCNLRERLEGIEEPPRKAKKIADPVGWQLNGL